MVPSSGNGSDPSPAVTRPAARSAEVRGARWAEIDRVGAVWTIPGESMKAGREHRVPLASRAPEMLDEAAALFGDDPVFPSPTGKVANHSLMPTLLRELEIGAVPHGFRSSFRDWTAECTDAPREVCELALAHVNSDRVEAAYRRTDLFDRRRELMRDWAAYIAAASSSRGTASRGLKVKQRRFRDAPERCVQGVL